MPEPITPFVIPKRSKVCHGTEKPFKPGMEVFSVLHVDENGELVRKDYCPSYWLESGEEKLLQEAWGHWKLRIPKPSLHAPTKHERAMELLKRLMDDPEQEELSFLFAQYLLRNKHLIPCFGDKKGPDKKRLYCEIPGSGEVIDFAKVTPEKRRLQELEAQLLELIEEMQVEEEEAS